MKRGITVVELVVCVAVIAVLLGLLLPAVQGAREASRVTSCSNKLKQMALASHEFDTAYQHFPSNGWGYRWVADPNRGFGKRQPGGWIYHILPYCETPLVRFVSTDPIEAHELRAKMLEVPMDLFRCPSRNSGQLGKSSWSAAPINASFVAFVAKTDYAANEGDFIPNTGPGPQSVEETLSREYRWNDVRACTGVVILRGQIRTSDVVDGLSNTYLLGEKYVRKASYFDNDDLGHDQSLLSGVDLDVNRWTISKPRRDSESAQVRIFGSPHQSVGMALCDGAVVRQGFDIDGEVHRALGNRRDAK